MKREGREIWTDRVQRLGESSLTDVEFAAEIGVKVDTLRAWKYRLRRGPKLPGRRGTGRKKTSFVEVTPAMLSGPELEIVVDERTRIRVPVGFDDETLSRILSALGRPR